MHRRELLQHGMAWAAAGPLLGMNGWATAAALPAVAVGRLERWADLPSRHVIPRPVDVWIPPGLQAGQPYRLLCMHDGQMLFDARTTWNQQAWNAHEAVHRLMQAGRLLPTVVLGIWNREGHRYAEYFPEKALALAPAAARESYIRREAQGQPKADAYLRFIVEDLLPRVEARWGAPATPHPGTRGVMVAGASMGGLISLYALCEYPQVFSGGAGLSTHWVSVAPSRNEQDKRNQDLSIAFLEYLQQQLPRAGLHRVWADRGDDTLDALYEPGLKRFGELLRERGYTERDGVARAFPGTGHNETDWSRRLAPILAFIAGGV